MSAKKHSFIPFLLKLSFSAFVFVVLLELPFYTVVPPRKVNHSYATRQGKTYYIYQYGLCSRPLPFTDVEATETIDGNEIYRVRYAIDRYYRRVTPVRGGERKDFLLFFGCSNTYGEGVNAGETLPYYAGEAAPGYTPYNYAFHGHGPQQMLVQLEREPDIRGEVREKHGKAVYVFLDDHVNRAIGSFHVYALWGKDYPRYELDGNDRPVRKGTFRSSRPLSSLVYGIAGHSRFFAYLMQDRRYDFPPLRRKHFYLTSRIIEASRDAFRKKFGSDEFYVVFFPGTRYAPFLKPYFDKAGIRYLDYSGLVDYYGDGRYRIHRLDIHPSPFFNKLLAEKLSEDLHIAQSRPVKK